MKKRRRLNIQKLFCFISFIFILTCCFWYGGRGIYYYLDANKEETNEQLLARKILKKEKKLKQISSNYYFYKETENNYLVYSNIVFRILKINKNNEVTIISDKPITLLANGKNKTYKTSYITEWLNTKNKENTGILQSNLNEVTKYLIKNKTCIDNINNIKNITCNDIDKSNFLSPLTIIDYINAGGKDSFINNGYYTYLANNSDEKVWYVNDEGKLDTNEGEEILGVKFTVTLKPNTNIIKGNGSEEDPYIIEETTDYFASYVKLDNDLWQVYHKDGSELKLSLTNYLEKNSTPIEYNYANNTYFHNDTKNGTLAYYLNNNYLKNLKYKDFIITANYYNNIYNEENEYDYKKVITKTVDTKVANLSIGNVFLNNLDNYFISTAKDKTTMYIAKKDFRVDEADVSEEKYIIPCITIKKESIIKGNGTKNDPYRTE